MVRREPGIITESLNGEVRVKLDGPIPGMHPYVPADTVELIFEN